MRLAMIGLGRMGGNMSERLMKGGHEMVVFDRTPATAQKYVALGATASASISEVPSKLKSPRVVWIMVPAGEPVGQTIPPLTPGPRRAERIIHGGRSQFPDSIAAGVRP